MTQIHNPHDQPIREKVMPIPHLMLRYVRANNTFFIANRGGFKTTMGISFYEIDCITDLPRSTGVLVGPSYEHLGDNTVNPLFNALNEDGFQPGVHYVYGTKPPDHWPQPHIRVDSVKKYDHMVSWWNGANQFLISMQKKGSANGISAQWGVFDEVKLLDEKELVDVVFPVFRGNEQAVIDDENHPRYGKKLSDSPLFMSKFFSTDKLADPAKIQWILDKRKKNDNTRIDLIILLQHQLDQLKEVYNSAGINKKKKLQTDINAIEVRLSKLRANLTFYVEADHTHTQQILGKRWYDDKVKNMREYERKVAIENQDPDRPEDGFYPDFNLSIHTHSCMEDYNPNRPFIVAPDYQHSVSPIPIAQLGKLPGSSRTDLLYIDQVHTLAPQGLDDAVDELCKRYSAHLKKQVYYVYDHTATGRRQDAEKFKDIVVKAFRRNKWRVIEVYTGLAPEHYTKYTDTKAWLGEQDTRLPRIRVNKVRCPNMITSITTAPAKATNGKTEKDKKWENTTKYPTMDQSTTTHYSDCFDMINHAVLKLKRVRAISRGGGGLGMR